MELSRRDLLKVGAVQQRRAHAARRARRATQLAIDNRIPQSELPAPVHRAVRDAAGPARPSPASADTDYYIAHPAADAAPRSCPAASTDDLGLQRHHAGPDDREHAGPQGRRAPDQRAARRPSDAALQRLDLDAPARVGSLPQYDGYASDITPPGRSSRTTTTRTSRPRGRSGTTTTASTSRRRTPTSAWPRSTSCTTRSSRRCLPQGEFDVPLIVKDAMFAAERPAGLRRQQPVGLYGDVILVNGRPWPVMKVERRIYRFRILNASSRARSTSR